MDRHGRWIGGVVVLVATAVAALSARPYAGGWNDGSRLATVECLIDYHTLAIDHSIFVKVPPDLAPPPYPPDEPQLLQSGTGDKLSIDGHFYSDKSPVPALLMAGVYQVWQWLTCWTARERPDLFCWVMTVLSSGLAYVVAAWSIYQIGRELRLSLTPSLILTASFALATVALPYAQHVNNHILLLGVAALIFLGLTRLSQERDAAKPPPSPQRKQGFSTRPCLRCGLGARPLFEIALVGTLAGLGYTFDLGTGPVLLAGTLTLIVFRCRRVVPVGLFLVSALPWLVLHHAVNYAVGGTFQPANAVPEYFLWPGSSFNATNLTGGWQHPSIGHFLWYAIELLASKKGFLNHNPALFLLLPALFLLARRRLAERPELLLAVAWNVGTWLAYAATSNNASGLCCTVRWFVPLLASSYYVVAVLVREFPRLQTDLLVLSGWGLVLAALMAWQGPWMKHMVPFYWPIVAATLLSWGGLHFWRWRTNHRARIRQPPQLADAA
jgi:hypothetical protein